MSRARHGTTLHAVADDLDQASHGLGCDWGNDLHQRWIGDFPPQASHTSLHETGGNQPHKIRIDEGLGL